MRSTTRLRELLAGPEILVIPGVPDALTARVVEGCGFAAVYVTGAGFANASFGLPDVGLVTAEAVVEHTRRIADVVEVPVIIDADTGYGGVLNVARTIRQLERAGASAIQIEDQTFPKRCGHFDGQTVIPTDEMVAKIRAAVDARIDDDLVLIARTDARASEGFEAAIDRGHAYVEAGADVIFVEAPTQRDEVIRIPGEFAVPAVANVVEGGKTPLLDAAELQQFGYQVALFANTALRVATLAVRRAMGELARTGTTKNLLDEMISWEERQSLVGLPALQSLEARYFGSSVTAPTGS
jgi:2-methylisocitrate lyase-like PEP mutase family enzyme